LFALLGVVLSLVVWSFGNQLQAESKSGYDSFPQMVLLRGQFGLANAVVGFGIGVTILTGAIMMKRLRYYWVAVLAALLTLLPNCSCCSVGLPASVMNGPPSSPQLQFWLIVLVSLVGAPLGLWCLILLNRSDVKASFR
jgi:hypothetical protein